MVAAALLALAAPSLDLADLPRFKDWTVGAVTSYDRTGGNDDGFSGRYSFVRKEGDAWVLADLKGPGCVTRFHTPTPTDAPLEFYVDGEAKPRLALPFRDYFKGPLAYAEGGGFTSYRPIPYAMSCKVVVRGPVQFYDLNYASFKPGTPVRSFDPKAPQDDATTALEAVREFYLLYPGLEFAYRPLGKPTQFATTAPPNRAATLFESKGPGRILSLRLAPASALAGKARDLLLRVTWDGAKAPAILMPVGDFFGYAWGKPTMASAFLGAKDDVAYCNLPMPYAKGAKIELVSRRGTPVTVQGSVVVSPQGRRPDEGRFVALWRRENPTAKGKPFTWVDLKGRGHLVGLSLQAQGLETGNTFFFEGDDVTTLDGQMAVHGTGSEDFFNGGWYDLPGRWDRAFSLPFSGSLGYDKSLGRTGGYRFLIADAYPFAKSLTQTIEHGPENNAHPTDYVGVAYLYLDRLPTPPVEPSAVAREVSDPRRIVFAAHWTTPIDGFSPDGATLTRGGDPRVLSLKAGGGGFVTLRLDLPAGRYRVSLDAMRGPDAPTVRAEIGEAPIGAAADLRADRRALTTGIAVGEFDATEGPNRLTLRLVGDHPANLEVANVVCERVLSRR